MPRFSVALDDEENEWIERLAEERDRSKSSLVASIVEAAHAEGFDEFVSGESSRTTANRLDELEERLDALEDAAEAGESPMYERTDRSGAFRTAGTPPNRGDGDDEADEPDGEDAEADVEADSVDEEELTAALEEYLADRPPHKAHGKRAAVATVLVLREHGTMSTGELQQAVYETGDLAANYTDARTLWNSISRYLDDVPGAEKAGYGEWGYAGDDVVLAETRTDAE